MNKELYQLSGMVAVSAFLGVTALLVSFGAGAAFETPGPTSLREASATCIAAALYLAFCQFWVAPRRTGGFQAKLLVLAASVAPLLVVVTSMRALPWPQAIAWLACGCLGSVLGGVIAQSVVSTSPRAIPPATSVSPGGTSRHYLLAGLILLAAVTLVIPIGVLPSVLADNTPGFNAGSVAVFLGSTALFALLAAVLLAFALWRYSQPGHLSKGTLGITAFLALFQALGFALMSSRHGLNLRTESVLLMVCALFGLITTVLMTIASVGVDRARLRV